MQCPHCKNHWKIPEHFRSHIYENRREIYLISLRQRFLKQLTNFYIEAEKTKTEKELTDLIKKQRIVTIALNLKCDRGTKTFYDMWTNGHNVTETTFLTVEDVADLIHIDTYNDFHGNISRNISVYIEIKDDVLYSFTRNVTHFLEIDTSLAKKIKLKQKLLQ